MTLLTNLKEFKITGTADNFDYMLILPNMKELTTLYLSFDYNFQI